MKKNKSKFIAEFQMFWYDQAGYHFDYPSLEFYFKDGSRMKMFISPWYWDMMGIYIPKVVFTYEDDKYTIETPGFAPAANQNGKKVETYFNDWMDYLKNNGIDVTTKKISETVENILTK